jgi:hypothetical protein
MPLTEPDPYTRLPFRDRLELLAFEGRLAGFPESLIQATTPDLWESAAVLTDRVVSCCSAVPGRGLLRPTGSSRLNTSTFGERRRGRTRCPKGSRAAVISANDERACGLPLATDAQVVKQRGQPLGADWIGIVSGIITVGTALLAWTGRIHNSSAGAEHSPFNSFVFGAGATLVAWAFCFVPTSYALRAGRFGATGVEEPADAP